MRVIFILTLICLSVFVKAQPGYKYNGATNRYEYQTDPFGDIARRYQNYTNMQIETLQRFNRNLEAINQASTNSVADMKATINATVELGKRKIKEGKATNNFKWVFDESVTQQEKAKAVVIQQVVKKQQLDINNYCEVKAFFSITYYLIYTGSKEEGIIQKKGEAARTKQYYLTNEYAQGMDDTQKTTNLLGEISTLERIATPDPFSNEAKNMAAGALQNRGFAHPSELLYTTNGLLHKGEENIKAGKTKTTFSRKPENLYVKNLLSENKINSEQAAKYKSYMQDFDKLVQKLNGPDNDHAFGKALLFSIYYTVYNDGKQLNGKQFDWVAREYFMDILKDKNMQAGSDEKLQQHYEKMAIDCMELSAKYALAKYSAAQTTKKLDDKNVDPLALMGERMTNRSYDDERNLKQTAYLKLKEFFQPRNFDSYILNDEGFVKK